MKARRFARGLLWVAAIASVVGGAAYFFDRYSRPEPRPRPKLLASLDHSLRACLNESDAIDRHFAPTASPDWRQLDDAERDWLVDEICRDQDIFAEWKGMVLTDLWGTPVRIEMRRPASGIEFRTSSAAADRTFGTADDIVYWTGDDSPKNFAD